MSYEMKLINRNSLGKENSQSPSGSPGQEEETSSANLPRSSFRKRPGFPDGSKDDPGRRLVVQPLEETTVPSSTGHPRPATPRLTDEQMLDAISRFTRYLEEGRDYYYSVGQPLGHEKMTTLARFFSPALLTGVRIVELAGRRIPNPPFYPEARALGFANLPDITHKASVTFLDVVVFNERITERNLFHGLVHVAQLHVLGIERFVSLFLRGFLRTKSYFLVPIKAHAFALDARFAKNYADNFSVEEEVQRWLRENLY